MQQAIHVGSQPYHGGHAVEMHLLNDFMVSLLPQLVTLMENYKVRARSAASQCVSALLTAPAGDARS